MKKSQLIMLWFLPLIVIGGLFYPLLGYLMVAMIAFFLTLSIFKPRYWCWNLCPRGAFLDIVMSRLSRNKPFPKLFAKNWFRLTVFILLMGLMVLRILRSGGNLIVIGSIFVSICLVTTIIAIILAVLTRHRAWCALCPMGFLQEKIGKFSSLHVSKSQGGKVTKSP
jgi:ferredoxin-type protein NapH